MDNKLNIGYYESPIGILKITGSGTKIISLNFDDEVKKENLSEVIIQCKIELDEYFNGKRTEFNVELEFLSGTEFQRKVWEALRGIPYGETVSYKYIANKIGNVNAVRAVGGANNKNNISILIPCHRVIGSNGKLVGYEGGLDKKIFLLELEKKNK